MWMNGEYIRKTQNSDLKSLLLDFEPALKEYDQTLLEQLIEPAKTRMKTIVDFKNFVIPFLKPEKKEDKILVDMALALEQVAEWNSQNILDCLVNFMKSNNLRYPQIYEALIGQKQGLPLGEVFQILGKEESLNRLK